MRGGRRIAALGALGALVAGIAAAALAGTSGASGPSQVVARDDAGRLVASLPLPPGRSFGLAYRHSYERAPAEGSAPAVSGKE